ncbi:MAG: ATP-binding protein [Faecousia sp.]
MKVRYAKDKRVKAEIFPFHIFLVTFMAVGVFTTVQMHIIGEYIDYTKIAPSHAIAIPALWIMAAATFTLLTMYQLRSRYQKPIEDFAKAARKVASGDFSVYLAPRHTPDQADYLDVLFMDFNKMVEELGSIETLKTDFFSNVSHEIKTPLAVIQNNAELLQNRTEIEEERQERIEVILQATHRLSGLITNMLKLNKLEKQVIQPVPEPFDVSAQLCECALQFEDIWEKKNITFDADLEERVMIEADAGLLEIVWNNLLSNALKFTADGGTVSLTQTSDRDTITVCICDTGCGMDENTLKHIFDKFYQGDTSHATEGNGLGLALVQRILQLSDGTIAVKSTPGKGSSFTVTLPAARKQEDRS